MSSLLVCNRVYRLEIQSVMLVFLTPQVNQRRSNFFTGSLTPLSPSPPLLSGKINAAQFLISLSCLLNEYNDKSQLVKNNSLYPFTNKMYCIYTSFPLCLFSTKKCRIFIKERPRDMCIYKVCNGVKIKDFRQINTCHQVSLVVNLFKKVDI